MTNEQMKRLLDVCIALSAERDREALLFRILDTAMDLTNCDGGTLYLLEADGLHFCRMVTRSFGIRQGGVEAPITLPPVPLKQSHVCARAVLEGDLINVPDVKADTRFDFSGAAKYDAMTGYSTRSMLVFPLTNDRGRIIGVLQLINALTESGEISSFPEEWEPLVNALASQAAISLTNMQYADRVRSLLDSLVRALSTAIDERTPYNANHSRNMARYADSFLDWLERTGNDWKFDPDHRREFLMSVWLHDVGKLTVPLDVMDKQSRLGPGLKDVQQRFATMNLLTRIDVLEGRISSEDAEALSAQHAEALALVEKVDRAGFLPDDTLAAIDALAGRTYRNENGEELPWITKEEHVCLSIRKGTLTAAERQIMEDHVVVTGRILDQVAFPEEYSNVPVWAAAHHELLNGKGYPQHLTAEDLPSEVRLLTILDVFDALTAKDRPYKPGMPVEKALSILHSMVSEGSMDENILALFEQSRAWEEHA